MNTFQRSLFRTQRQLDSSDCGPACLKMMANYHGIAMTLEKAKVLTDHSQKGISFYELENAARKLGLEASSFEVGFEGLRAVDLPCILHWDHRHFVVLLSIKDGYCWIADPAHGKCKMRLEALLKHWLSEESERGFVLSMERNFKSTSLPIEKTKSNPRRSDCKFISRYLSGKKELMLHISVLVVVSLGFSLVVPFLTRSVVDVAIQQSTKSLVILLLACQLAVFAGRTLSDALKRWSLLYFSSNFSLRLLHDFTTKLLRLPLSYYDKRTGGDIIQRMDDHRRIENLIGNMGTYAAVSLMNLLVYSIVLGIFSMQVLWTFVAGSVLSIGWLLFFIKRRSLLDKDRFRKTAQLKDKLFQIVHGISEIKANNCEDRKLEDWYKHQAGLHSTNISNISLNQFQEIGNSTIIETQSIIITAITAFQVIDGNLTLGTMLAISYVLGQAISPLYHLIGFARSLQETKLSLNRIREIHDINTYPQVSIGV